MTRARIVAVTLRPTPRPVAISTPQAIPRLHTVLALQQRPIARAFEGRRGGSLAHRAPPVALRARVAYASRPIWDAGSGGSGPGRGISNGSGAGASTQGSGSGTASAAEPCGFVTFSNPHGSHYDTGTHGFWVDIRLAVHFSDGTSQSLILDYPWYYASEAANPWSERNLRDPSFPTRFQPPPPSKIGGEPPLVQYVIAHSTPDGMTLLHDCPETSPTPAT